MKDSDEKKAQDSAAKEEKERIERMSMPNNPVNVRELQLRAYLSTVWSYVM